MANGDATQNPLFLLSALRKSALQNCGTILLRYSQPSTMIDIMIVSVRLFAMLRERAGQNTLALQLDNNKATINDALRVLKKRRDISDLVEQLPLGFAVNGEYTTKNQLLSHGDELALIPPVSGGSTQADHNTPQIFVEIRERQLSLDGAITFVKTPKAGALVTFSGTTRDVPRLEYEAYADMAQKELEKIVKVIAAKQPVQAIYVGHRIGSVPLGETSIVIAVSAAHRAAAFGAAREILDQTKCSVPIWKKEIGEDTQTWVSGTPIEIDTNEHP